MGWEKTPLVLSLLLAGPDRSERVQSEILIFLNRIPNWNKLSRTPCVSLMWSAEVARGQRIQNLSGPVIPLSLNGCDACGVEQIIINPGQHLRTTALLTLALRWGKVKPEIQSFSMRHTRVHSQIREPVVTGDGSFCLLRTERGGRPVLRGGPGFERPGLVSLSLTFSATLNFCASFCTYSREGVSFIKNAYCSVPVLQNRLINFHAETYLRRLS